MMTSKILEQQQKGEVAPAGDSSMSWEEFEKEYLVREDEFKYEWVRGQVVKTKRAMNQHQYFILKNIERLGSSWFRVGKHLSSCNPSFTCVNLRFQRGAVRITCRTSIFFTQPQHHTFGKK